MGKSKNMCHLSGRFIGMNEFEYFYLKINFIQTYDLDKLILANLYMVLHFSNLKCLLNACFILVCIQLLKNKIIS